MHDKKLRSIAEYNENEGEIIKWVPKKKHEVLKAKYKCLKKLFQIYDASVIGILPETVLEEPTELQKTRKSHRRKRSYRTKSDAAAETSEQSSGDVTQTEQEAASNVIKELKLNVSTPILGKLKDESTDKGTQDSPDNVSIIIEKTCDITSNNPRTIARDTLPAQRSHKRKPTRFQAFIHRILGLNTDSLEYLQCNDKYFCSDNNISNYYERRRQRGLRLRRISRNLRAKKTHSDIVLGNTQSPMILSYVQTVQKSCLLDTTPRQCPIPGCKMVFNGIINYNDHLNLCHFPEKKFICNYCHDGFYTEHDKVVHENEHIGISKLSNIPPTPQAPHPPATTAITEFREPAKITNTNDCQTEAQPITPKIDVPDAKLKKIVSFFEKFNDPDEIIAEIKKSRISESNIKTKRIAGMDPSDSCFSKKTTKCASSITCNSTKNKAVCKCDSTESDGASLTSSPTIKCGMCGDKLFCRRKMSLHSDMEQRLRNKFQKFHSCVGILSQTSETEEPETNTQHETTDKYVTLTTMRMERQKSKTKELRCEPSTNIIYFTSTESLDKKPSVIDSFVHRVRSGFSYKWEPGTKIIRV